MDEMGDQQGSCSGGCEEVDSNEVSQSGLGDLPEVCIAMILSWLAPREIAKMACVCRSFRGASSFDSVWENVLSKYKGYLALDPDAVPARFTSKREILDHLCRPTIFANKTQAIWIDRYTGLVCRSVGAKGISIIWVDDPRYWTWDSDPEVLRGSLFPEVARLKDVCWFEASGEMEFSLPPGDYTFTWRMYLDDLHGWHSEPAIFTLCKNDVENFECKCNISNDPNVSRRVLKPFRLPTVRILETGWSEYDVGEFTVRRGEEIRSLKFKMTAYERGHWKGGLLMDGIVIRPTETVRRIPTVESHHKSKTPPPPRRKAASRRFFAGQPSFSNFLRGADNP